MHDRYSASTYTVVKVMQNGNSLLHSNKSNEVLATPCPLQALKEVCKERSRNADYKYKYKCNKDDYCWDAKQYDDKNDSRYGYQYGGKKGTCTIKENIVFQIDMTSNLTSSLTSSSDVSVTSSTKENNNRSDELEFVDDILDVTGENVLQDELESLDSDDEFTVEVWSVSKAQNWPF